MEALEFRGNNACDGLHIPLYNAQGIIEGDQLRPHDPPVVETLRADGTVKRAVGKYLLRSGAKMQIFVPLASRPYLDNIDIPLVIAESPLKALAIIANAPPGSLCVIAIIGVWGWRTKAKRQGGYISIPLPQHKNGIAWCLKDRDGRVRKRRGVYLVFDSDVLTNRMVSRARYEYTVFLDGIGADVWWIDVPAAPDGGKQGVDDDIASGHSWEALLESAYRAPEEAPELAYAAPSDGQETELDRLRRDNLKLEAENRKINEKNRAYQLLILNPRLTLKQIQLGVRTITLAHSALSQTPTGDDPPAKVLPDGSVQIKKAAIAQDYRPIPAKGEKRMEVNPLDGSKPLAPRSSVGATLKSLAGCIDVDEKKVRKQHLTTQDWYWDTDIIFRPSASQADDLGKIASFSEYKKRKEYTHKPEQKECPHCHKRHEWAVVCTGCGRETDARRNQPSQPAPNDDVVTEHVAESAITKNVMASNGDDAPASPPITYLSTKNVMPPEDTPAGRSRPSIREEIDQRKRAAEPPRQEPIPDLAGLSRDDILNDMARWA